MKRLITFLSLLIIVQWTFGQTLSGTRTVPTSSGYATIKAAIDSLNAYPLSGTGIIIYVQPGYTETITAPLSLTATGTSVSNSIVFQKTSSGANPKITAYVGTNTPASVVQDGIWNLVGSDYVTIDGIDLYDPNSSNPATMEYGFAMFKVAGTYNGCQYNTIKNCVVTLSYVNNASGSGPAVEGSRAINVVNATVTAQTTAITGLTTAVQSNSYNKFYSNTLQNCNYGIVLYGFAATTPFTPGDFGNDVGGTSSSTGNTFYNFGGAASASNPAAGVRANNEWDLNVSYNIMNNNNGSGSNHVSTLRGIYGQAGTSANVTINNNNIILKGGGTSTQISAIENVIGSTAASNTVNINNNNIHDCTYSTGTTATFYGIYNSATPATLNINGNTIENINYTGAITSGTFLGILNSATAIVSINNNIINNLTISGTGTCYAISVGSPVGAGCTANGNNITNITRTGASGTQRGIVMTSPTNNMTFNSNLIDGIYWTNTASSGAIDGIYGLSSSTNVTINNNTIRNLSTPTTGTIQGIREFGSSGTKIVQGNQVYNFYTYTGGAGGATFNGIYCSTGNIDMSSNSVYNLNSTGTTGGTAGAVYGLYVSGGTTNQIYKNNAYNLSSNSTNPLIAGVYLGGGTTNTVSNNFISDLRAPYANAANVLNGIYATGGTTYNLYYNTIYLNGTSSGALFGSSGIYASTTPTVDIRNNVVINISTANGTGYTVAYRRSGSTLTSYASTSNYNDFFAGTPGTYYLIFFDGTNSDQTIAAFQTRVSPRDALSFSENPPFINVATTPYNLHMQTTVSTKIESGGANVTGITTDFDADIRQGNAGYSGTGTAPDVGADEFNGIPSYTCTAPTPGNTLSTINPICLGQSIILSLQNPITGTGNTYQWQSSTNGSSFNNIDGATSSTYTTAPITSLYYQCVVTCQNGPVSATSNPIHITFPNSITSTTPDARCGTGQVSLEATVTGGTITWYSALTGGTLQGTGSPFTPTVGSTTTYYVSADNVTSYSGDLTIGTGTSLTSSTGYPTVYGDYWYQDWQQLVYTAAELQALGYNAGNITAIKYNVATIPAAAPTLFTIRLGSTSNSTLSSFQTTGLTVYYGPVTPTMSTGWNTFTLTTPYAWDGLSNILVDIRMTEAFGSASSTCYYTATTGNTVISAYSSSNNPSFYNTPPSATGSTSRLNVKFNGSFTNTCGSSRVAVVATVLTPDPLTITPSQNACTGSIYSMQVTSPLGNYDNYSWSPVTDLYTDNLCTVHYTALTNASIVYVKPTAAGTIVYTCTGYNSTTECGNTANSSVTSTLTPPAPTTTGYSLCTGGTIKPGEGLQSTSIGAPLTNASQTINFNVTVQPPDLQTPAPPGAIVASANMAALPAGSTVTSIVYTYNNITANSPSYQSEVRIGLTGAITDANAAGTGALGASGIFNYVRTVASGFTVNYSGGTVNLMYYESYDDGIVPDATFPLGNAVASVVINYTYPDPNNVKWYTTPTDGTVQGTGSPFNPLGIYPLDSNTPGTYTWYAEVSNGSCPSPRTSCDLVIGSEPSVTATADPSEPVCDGSVVTLTAVGAGGGLPYTYSWKVDDVEISTLESLDVTINQTITYDLTLTDNCDQTATSSVTVTMKPVPTANATSNSPVCSGHTLHLYGSTDIGTSFNWTGPNGFNSIEQNPSIPDVTLDASGTYYFTATHNGCTSIESEVTVVINPSPSTLAITPASAETCPGTIVQLDANGGTIEETSYSGTGAYYSTGITPFKGYFGGQKTQNLYLASELASMGLSAGSSINKVTYWIYTFTSPYTFKNFTISMKNTTSTVLTTTLETGTTDAWGPSTYTLSGTAPFGITFTLTTPFTWDGTSNLIIETCYNNSDAGGSSGNSAGIICDLMTSNLCAYYTKDSNPTVCSNPDPALTSTSTYRVTVGLEYNNKTTFTWSPYDDLYSNPGATIPYAGEDMPTVYSKVYTVRTYTATATSNLGCTSFASATITGVDYTVGGTLKYNNTAKTPMINANLALNPGGYTATTDGGGNYAFTNICNGNYTISLTNANALPGGINSTDAVQMNVWNANQVAIPHVKFLAGEVDYDVNSTINATDALAVQNYFVFHTPFDRTLVTGQPWVMWKAGDIVLNNADPNRLLTNIPVTVAGSNTTVNLYGQAIGDFSGSYTPYYPVKGSMYVELVKNDTKIAGAGAEIDLPVRMMNQNYVSAVSLILNFPSDLARVTGVSMNGLDIQPVWSVTGNELRIGWNTTNPLWLGANEELLTISIVTTEKFGPGSLIRFSLASDPLNELADASFEVINNAVLGMDAVEFSANGIVEPADGNSVTLNSRPNPFADYTILSYSTPVEGRVTLKVADMFGREVVTLVNENKPGGNYTCRLDSEILKPGVYTATITLDNGNGDIVKTIKLIRK